jgi:diguanylate cyclase (GGDEF)-like protein
MPIEFIKACFSFLGTIIFAAWIFFGHIAGLVVLGIAILANLITAWTVSDYSVSVQIFLYAVLAAAASYMRLKMQSQIGQTSLKIEELQKNRNILTEGTSSHKGVQEALKKKLHRFFQLKELINSLSVHLDIEDVAEITLDAAFNIVGKTDACYFYVVDTEQQQLALTAAKQKNSANKIKGKTGDIFDHWTFKHRQPLLIEDVRKDYRFDVDKGADAQNDFKSLISSPLIIEEKVAGLVRLNGSRPNAFLPNDLRLLDIITSLASVSLENTFLYLEAKELAIRDSLTGIYVQKFFKERLQEEVTRALRGDYPVSVLLMDIDFFKAYNDNYGHTAGDIVLKRVAGILTQATHEAGDIVARYGGEEFGVILANKTKQAAMAFAEGIRKRIEGESFLLRREETKMTVSIGVASCPDDAKICEDLIKASDDALYKAKKSGRNCVAAK